MPEAISLVLAGHYGEALERSDDLAGQARLHRFLGDTEAGLRNAREVLRQGREANDPHAAAEGHYLIASQLKFAGEFDAAAESLRVGARLLRDLPPTVSLGSLHLEEAELEILRGDRAAAQGPLRRGCIVAHEMGDPRLLAWSLFLHGQLARCDDAIFDFSAVLEIAEALPCPELVWQAYWELARRLRPEERRPCLDRAYTILSSLAEGLPEAHRGPFWSAPNRQRFLDDWAATSQDEGADSDLRIYRSLVRPAIPPYGSVII